MSTTKNPMRIRKLSVAGGIALLSLTGTGLASTSTAASTTSSAATLAKIKYCESGGNYHAVNTSSGASGAYQFLPSTWRGLTAAAGYASAASAPASVQDAAARELYNQAGTTPWAASSGCWSKLSSVPSSSLSTSANTTGSSNQAAAAKSAASSVASNAAPTSSKSTGTHHATPANKPAHHPHARPIAATQKLDSPPHHGGKHQARAAVRLAPKTSANALPRVA